MTKVDELREQYRLMASNMPAEMQLMFQGIQMGIDLAAGAAAQDYAAKLEAQLAAGGGGDSTPSWRRGGGSTGRTRDMTQLVTVYGITDPMTPNQDIFYVGSSSDPESQLRDYIRTEDMGIGCKPRIEEIIGAGMQPGIEVLEKDVKLGEVNAVKAKWIKDLTEKGLVLTNKRT